MFGFQNNLDDKGIVLQPLTRCSRCTLPITYPGVKLDENNICNYCHYYAIYEEREAKLRAVLRERFVEKIREAKNNKSKYDCIVAFSGGKDSTFLLSYLKKNFDLNILAHTLDNGFVSKKALENIDKITKQLNVEHRFTRPDSTISKEVFSYALQGKLSYPKEVLSMMSSVCAVCIAMVFGTTIKLAMKMKIPLMFMGFTPGQYPAISLENFLKVESCIFLSEKICKDDPVDIIKILRDPVDERFGRKVEKYFFKSQYIEKGTFVPSILFPFHALLDYDENIILQDIVKLGWEKPQDTDSCSSNCLLNTLGNYSCLKQLGYHPYVGELSLLARKGRMSYHEVVMAERIETNSFAMRDSLKKLNLTRSDLEPYENISVL